MISIIISSKNNNYLEALKTNIAQTIGCQFEVIVIQNDRQYSICEAYNMGAAKAAFDYLCFIHEDIEILSQNWGNLLIANFLKDETLGVIGLAGSIYKSMIISTNFLNTETYRSNIYQRINGKNKLDYYNPNNETISPVVVLDGVWLVVKKTVYDMVKFNENLLLGFHGYDVDFSCRASAYCKLAVVYNVKVSHFSLGNFDNNWFEAQELVNDNLLKIFCKSFLSTSEFNTNNAKKYTKLVFKKNFKPLVINPQISKKNANIWLGKYWKTGLYMPIYTLKNYIRLLRKKK